MNSLNKFKSSNIYNGADCESYLWSQKLNELEIIVPVPAFVKSAKHVEVFIQTNSLKVVINVDNEWKTLITADFVHSIKSNSALWTLEPSEYIQISIEKVKEIWWKELINGEKQIKLGKVDRSVKLEDLSSDVQTIVHNLTAQQYLKLKKSS